MREGATAVLDWVNVGFVVQNDRDYSLRSSIDLRGDNLYVETA